MHIKVRFQWNKSIGAYTILQYKFITTFGLISSKQSFFYNSSQAIRN